MNFDSGVKSYITGKATVEVHFPVDWHGNADISCKQCRFYVSSTRKCALTGEVTAYPDKFVGYDCPLETEEGNDGTT